MINIKTEIYDHVYTTLKDRYPKMNITGEATPTPSHFPCVQIIGLNNTVVSSTQTQSAKENHASLLYQIDIFSNKQSGRMAECDEISGVIDEIFADLNFNRIFMAPTQNASEGIYRVTARYTAVVDRYGMLYRR